MLADGFGLFDQGVQRAKLPTQQPATEDGTEQPAYQQPDQAAKGAVPEFGQGELRVAQHFHARRLLPAAHDQRVAPLDTQVHQADEPPRYALDTPGNVTLYQYLLILDIDNANAVEVATVEN